MSTTRNPLYPVFLKLHQLRLLIVGAGVVGTEKLEFILKSSPEAQITVVAPDISDTVRELIQTNPQARIRVHQRGFQPKDIQGHDLVIASTNLQDLNWSVQQAAKAAGKLVNVADTPALCDFYLGSIVTRGPLKVAISTNGQSPTFAKRFRQLLEATIPEEVDELIDQLKLIRDQLQGDFEYKVQALNDLTAPLAKPGSASGNN